MSAPYFATGYVRLLYRFVRAEGVPESALFAGTGYSETDLMRADFAMPFEAEMDLVRNALQHAHPGLGLRVGHQLQLAAHGALGTAMQTAPDLRTALDTFAELVAVRASIFTLGVEHLPSRTRIDIRIGELADTLKPFFSESILFTLTNCVAFYTGHRDGVIRVELAYPEPPYGEAYAGVFGDHIAFACPATSVTFHSQLLTMPSPEADPQAFSDSVRRCRNQLPDAASQQPLVNRIEDFFSANPGRLWTVDEIAPLYAMSARTLIRRLRDNGTTFQALRDEALKRQAAIYLGTMSVEAAALALGFADPSSFRRTFKRWFGQTPSAYQATL